MKRILPTIKTCLLLFLGVATALHTNAQVVSSDICTTLGDTAAISLKDASGNPLTSIKTGLDFNLVMTLPGGLCQGGNYEITITTSNNLELGNTNPTYPFYSIGFNQFENSTVISSNDGLGINVPFKFKAGITCNNEIGTFNVTIKLICDGVADRVCTFRRISLKAEAANYWVVEKKHVFGDLSGGGIYWDVIIKNSNGNPGIGDLNIFNGSITDAVSSDSIISVTGGGLSGLTGLNTSTASWNTGTILSTTTQVLYRVQTYSCMPAGTVVTNCVKYNFCLGKEVKVQLADGVIPKARSSDSKISSAASIPPFGPVQIPCCDREIGEVCASVELEGTATTSANFSKSLTYDNNLNYAPGCEGEYQIIVSNNGNVPLDSLVITDTIPAGIQVFQISVTASGTSMDYDIPFGSTTTGFNTSGPNYSQTWTSGFPTQFNLNTTSGTLLGGVIIIKIKFKILAAIGTPIINCANLNYSGTYDGWRNWCGIQLPPPNQNVSAPQSCVSFIVQEPKAIPGISKCIIGGQQSFCVGEIIPFRIVVSNHGAESFSGNLADLLGTTSLQNLGLVPGSVQYSYGMGPYNPYFTPPGCINSFSNISTTPPSWVSVTQQTSQNLGWSISNMPGNCELEYASYLIIEYQATVLPQSFGNYINTAKLVATDTSTLATDTSTLNGLAYYNVCRTAQISTIKQVNTAFVEPGQSFNYIIVVKNEGSVALENIKVDDTLPSCVTYTARSARHLDVNGGPLSSVSVAWASPIFTFPSTLILQPGESVELTVTVTRNANDQNKQCCNPSARGSGITDDASADVISDVDGPVCVTSSLCCNIEDLDVEFGTTANNGGIVPVFRITGGTVPIQEIEISLIDYHAEYSEAACKPANMGNLFGHIQPLNEYLGTSYYNFNSLPFSGSPSLQLQTVVNPVNNSLTWSGSNPINLSAGGGGGTWPYLNFNGLIALNFIAPDIVNLDCCTGRVFYCFKVRVKDANCNVCEKIVCGSFEIPKERQREWRNEKAKSQFKLKSLEGNQNQGIKLMNGESLEEFMKRNRSK